MRKIRIEKRYGQWTVYLPCFTTGGLTYSVHWDHSFEIVLNLAIEHIKNLDSIWVAFSLFSEQVQRNLTSED